MESKISELASNIFSFTALKIVIGIAIAWLIAGMTLCSCCKYTIADMMRLASHFAYNIVSGNDEVSIEITDIRKKTCECKSPWYSPCVIWGSKSAKEKGCTKDCHAEKDPLENGIDESLTKNNKEGFGCGCGKTGTNVGSGVAATVNDNTILQSRGGNRY